MTPTEVETETVATGIQTRSNGIIDGLVDQLIGNISIPSEIVDAISDLPFSTSFTLVKGLLDVSGDLLNLMDFETIIDIVEGTTEAIDLFDLVAEADFSQIGFQDAIDLVDALPEFIDDLPVSIDFDLPSIVEGGGSNDKLNGKNSFDLIDGGDGNDRINGKGNSDLIYGGKGNDRINGGNGSDILNGDGDKDILNGGGNRDILNGGDGNDIINGGRGNDILNGEAGKDKLTGGIGDDIFNGGAGNDLLIGGGGSDRFFFSGGRDFNRADLGSDRLKDFETDIDKILLEKRTFSSLESIAGDGFSIIEEFEVVNGKNAATKSDAKIVYNSKTGDLYYNPNGSQAGFSSGGKFAQLLGKPELEATDFLIEEKIDLMDFMG